MQKSCTAPTHHIQCRYAVLLQLVHFWGWTKTVAQLHSIAAKPAVLMLLVIKLPSCKVMLHAYCAVSFRHQSMRLVDV